jgi:hypothetical protein
VLERIDAGVRHEDGDVFQGLGWAVDRLHVGAPSGKVSFNRRREVRLV